MTYEAWRISYQSSEQAARAAYAECARLCARLEAAEKERDDLRAKIEQMERQEPAGYGVLYVEAANGEEDWDSLWKHRVFAEDHVKDFVQAYSDLGESIGAITVVPLYLAPGAQPAPGVPEGWLRAIDEALVVAHIGVANASDTYEQAKVRLNSLICFHIDVATDPAVNGGYKLMPIEPTHETLMDIVGAVTAPLSFREVRAIYDTLLDAKGE